MKKEAVSKLYPSQFGKNLKPDIPIDCYSGMAGRNVPRLAQKSVDYTAKKPT